MSTTKVSRHIDASSKAIYAAILDPAAIAQWRVPDGMTAIVHEFDAREGGEFRVSLIYATAQIGKSSESTDTYCGRFVRIEPNHLIVEELAFETSSPEFEGNMRITTTLTESASGTEVLVEHEGIPLGVQIADNEIGTQMALAKLADLVERAH